MHRLIETIHSTWRDANVNGSVTIANASAGAFTPTDHCPTPRLWVLLVGHYRSFSWTRGPLAEVLNASVGSCYFVAAATPIEIDAVHRTGWWSPNNDSNWKVLASRNEAADALMAASTVAFGGRLAHVAIQRNGSFDRIFYGLAVGWHAAWAVACWAAQAHGVTIDPTSVVLRTRPDVLLRTAFSIDGLQQYIRHGRHGRHLMLTNDVAENTMHWLAQVCMCRTCMVHASIGRTCMVHALSENMMRRLAQSDYFAFTSFAAFESDVRRLLGLKAGPLGDGVVIFFQ